MYFTSFMSKPSLARWPISERAIWPEMLSSAMLEILFHSSAAFIGPSLTQVMVDGMRIASTTSRIMPGDTENRGVLREAAPALRLLADGATAAAAAIDDLLLVLTTGSLSLRAAG